MSHETIRTASGLSDLCQRLATAPCIGMDTEFVSEDTFRPQLCLVQVVTDDLMAVIDPFEVPDLSPFWEALAADSHVTVVHAAREEVNFSLHDIGRPPAGLFDIQIAAAFCSPDYPAAYGSVVSRFLGRRLAKGEQRTDWRRRPLAAAQIEYALEDVRHLIPLYQQVVKRLQKLGRLEWLDEEMQTWMEAVDEARGRQRWNRVSGAGGLSARSLAIVRELWLWRQAEAEQRDLPPRRVLRDDLIVEIAKHKSDTPERIQAIRGMQRLAKRGTLSQLAQCVRRGMDAPLDDLSGQRREEMPSQLNLLGQFLTPALSSICRNAEVAANLVGTASDVRDLIAHRLGFVDAHCHESPSLARGWRAKLVGNLIEDLLAGRKSIRIEDPHSEHPLGFDEVHRSAY